MVKATGQHPEFNEAALADLDISIEEWRGMTPDEQLKTISRWFREHGTRGQ